MSCLQTYSTDKRTNLKNVNKVILRHNEDDEIKLLSYIQIQRCLTCLMLKIFLNCGVVMDV